MPKRFAKPPKKSERKSKPKPLVREKTKRDCGVFVLMTSSEAIAAAQAQAAEAVKAGTLRRNRAVTDVVLPKVCEEEEGEEEREEKRERRERRGGEQRREERREKEGKREKPKKKKREKSERREQTDRRHTKPY